jgi:transcriptional regulator with XRE-family HTH domain
MTIGERIAMLRKQKNLSQYALAKSAKVTYSTLHMLESGKRQGSGLTLATAKRLARALGITLDELAREDDDEKMEEAA